MLMLSATQLKERLETTGIYGAQGRIMMSLNGTCVQIKTTDTIGNNLQEWLAQWMLDNGIYFRRHENTQAFPDFYLSEDNNNELLEVKSYFASRGPAFDVANFNSYWSSIRDNPSRLDADYLIFAYDLVDGALSVRNIYLKKVWEITGASTEYPLTCQRKSGQIYNIRPISFHSTRSLRRSAFTCKEQFIVAIYKSIVANTNKVADARAWLNGVIQEYLSLRGVDLRPGVDSYLRA